MGFMSARSYAMLQSPIGTNDSTSAESVREWSRSGGIFAQAWVAATVKKF